MWYTEIVKIIITDHARQRLKQRSISLVEIRQALVSPVMRKSSFNPTEIVQKITERGTLEIVFREKNQVYIIITAYYL